MLDFDDDDLEIERRNYPAPIETHPTRLIYRKLQPSRVVDLTIAETIIREQEIYARLKAEIAEGYQLDYNDDTFITEAERAELWRRYMVLRSVNLDAPRIDSWGD